MKAAKAEAQAKPSALTTRNKDQALQLNQKQKQQRLTIVKATGMDPIDQASSEINAPSVTGKPELTTEKLETCSADVGIENKESARTEVSNESSND